MTTTIPASRALTTALHILDTLADPAQVTYSPQASKLRTRPQSLGGGAAGIALAHIEAARAGHRPWSRAHAWLRYSTSVPVTGGYNATGWFGAPALALVTSAAAHAPDHLAQTRARLDTVVEKLTRQRLAQAQARIDSGEPPPLAEFDLIQGLTGLASVHLHTRPEAPITAEVLTYLARLAEPLPGRPDRPGWWSHQSPHATTSPDWPDGHVNHGMAHGIAAPLAILSLSRIRGVTVPGQVEAIERVCTHLDTYRAGSSQGTWWPYYLLPEHLLSGPTGQRSHQRPSWCYGTPGLARAQQLAGLALKDSARRRMAERAMADCLRDRDQLDSLTELGLCHGWAGLLHCSRRINNDAPSAPLGAAPNRVLTQLLDRLDHRMPQDPEFLDGRAGIALALLGTTSGPPQPLPWDACLALA